VKGGLSILGIPVNLGTRIITIEICHLTIGTEIMILSMTKKVSLCHGTGGAHSQLKEGSHTMLFPDET
jgi:hypothetical protein